MHCANEPILPSAVSNHRRIILPLLGERAGVRAGFFQPRHEALICVSWALAILTLMLCRPVLANDVSLLKPDTFRHYIDSFNTNDQELYPGFITNGAAWNFLKKNIPLFECPDKEIETTYYFRWWTYRKHIKLTPDGFIITEFLPDVPWAGKDDSIDCATGHHIYEGRWLADSKYLDDYSVFWFRKGGEPRRYSTWLADALWSRYLVNGNTSSVEELLPDLVKNYEGWE